MFRKWPFGRYCTNSCFTHTIRSAESHACWFSSLRELFSVFCSTKCWASLFFISALYRWGMFGRDGIINIHKQNPWTEDFSHGVIHSGHQQQFSINVRAGIFGDCLLGPRILPLRLIDNYYRGFLLHDLSKLLDYVPIAVRARMCASAHISRAVRHVFSNTWHDHGKAEEDPLHGTRARHIWIVWIFTCGDIAASADNKYVLHHAIVNACQTICNYPGIFERMRRFMIRRIEACNGLMEDIWSTLYKCTLSAISKKIKCFRRHIDMDIFSCFGMWNSCPNLSAHFSYTVYVHQN
jgi:hypothetical protein